MKKPLKLLLLGAGLGLAFTAATAVSDALAPEASAATLPPDSGVETVAVIAEPVAPEIDEPVAHAEPPPAVDDPATWDGSDPALGSENDAEADDSSGSASTAADQSSSAGWGTWTLYADGYCGNGAECAQSAVDSSNLAYIDYGPLLRLYAGHDYGPAGIIASMSVGDTVEILGVAPGRFAIVGTTYVHRGARIDAVSGIGLQTCVGAQMVVHTLESVP